MKTPMLHNDSVDICGGGGGKERGRHNQAPVSSGVSSFWSVFTIPWHLHQQGSLIFFLADLPPSGPRRTLSALATPPPPCPSLVPLRGRTKTLFVLLFSPLSSKVFATQTASQEEQGSAEIRGRKSEVGCTRRKRKQSPDMKTSQVVLVVNTPPRGGEERSSITISSLNVAFFVLR